MATIFLNSEDIKILSSLRNNLVDKKEILVVDKILEKESKSRKQHNILSRDYKREKRKIDKNYCRSKKQKGEN